MKRKKLINEVEVKIQNIENCVRMMFEVSLNDKINLSIL